MKIARIDKIQRVYEEAYFKNCGYDTAGIERQREMYGGSTPAGDHVRAGLRAVVKLMRFGKEK